MLSEHDKSKIFFFFLKVSVQCNPRHFSKNKNGIVPSQLMRLYVLLLVHQIFKSLCPVQCPMNTAGMWLQPSLPLFLSVRQVCRLVQTLGQLLLTASICNPESHALDPKITCEKTRQWHRYPVNTRNSETKEKANDWGIGAG